MKISRGLDVPISGAPEQKVYTSPNPVKTVAVIGRDFIGLKPTMKVTEGDEVKIGDVLFEDKNNPGVKFTSPGHGVVRTINRGARRVLQSVVIDVFEEEQALEYTQYEESELDSLTAEQVREQLLESGAWTAFLTRPYRKIPKIDSVPSSIFVTAMDTRPLAANPEVVIALDSEAFKNGIRVIRHLSAGKVFVSKAPGADIPEVSFDNVEYHEFSGPHPAGLVGTHIHFLDPVNASKTVWHIGYQDVMAIGKLFVDGERCLDRVVSLAGPMVKNPRLIRTRQGICTDCLVHDELKEGQSRVISGSVLGGFRSAGWSAYLGRFNTQVTVLQEGNERIFLHWLNPWLKQFSLLNVFFRRAAAYDMTSTQNGSRRAMVPLGNYEAVMPLDILPTQLLRALLVRDTDTAQQLGILELDEEDLSLCTFVCHSKYEYGPALRACLDQIEREG
jgi:Na+-transporting NADH:ubiquinone oxidoreductase subunit A